MALYRFHTNIICENSHTCTKNIQKNLIDKFPNLIAKDNESNFSLVIIHIPKKHYIRISICTKNNKEDLDDLTLEVPQKNKKYELIINDKGVISKTITVDNPIFKQIIGTVPSETQIGNALSNK